MNRSSEISRRASIAASSLRTETSPKPSSSSSSALRDLELEDIRGLRSPSPSRRRAGSASRRALRCRTPDATRSAAGARSSGTGRRTRRCSARGRPARPSRSLRARLRSSADTGMRRESDTACLRRDAARAPRPAPAGSHRPPAGSSPCRRCAHPATRCSPRCAASRSARRRRPHSPARASRPASACRCGPPGSRSP